MVCQTDIYSSYHLEVKIWTCLGQRTPLKIDEICPLAIPNQISTILMHTEVTKVECITQSGAVQAVLMTHYKINYKISIHMLRTVTNQTFMSMFLRHKIKVKDLGPVVQN